MLLEELKQRTTAQHRQLERELDIEARLGDPGSYLRLLKAFYGWWLPWETRVADSKFREICHFYDRRRKAGLLESDMEFLGASRGELAEVDMAELPTTGSPERLLGAMYVIEGSTLGGQIISRMIESRLGLTGGRGYSFYRSYGPQVGAMWKEFGSFFEENVRQERLDEAVEAAVDTFEGLRKWLSER